MLIIFDNRIMLEDRVYTDSKLMTCCMHGGDRSDYEF